MDEQWWSAIETWWTPKVWVQPASTKIYKGHRFGKKSNLRLLQSNSCLSVQQFVLQVLKAFDLNSPTVSCFMVWLYIYKIYLECIYIYIYIYILYNILMDHEILNSRCYAAWFPLASTPSRAVFGSDPRNKSSDVLTCEVRGLGLRLSMMNSYRIYKENWHQSTFGGYWFQP